MLGGSSRGEVCTDASSGGEGSLPGAKRGKPLCFRRSVTHPCQDLPGAGCLPPERPWGVPPSLASLSTTLTLMPMEDRGGSDGWGPPALKSGRPCYLFRYRIPSHPDLQMEINCTKVERATNSCCVMGLIALAKNERKVIFLIFVLMLFLIRPTSHPSYSNPKALRTVLLPLAFPLG